MGNRSKDKNAAASNNTKDRDQESNSRDQDIRDTSLAKAIAEAVAQTDPSYRRCVSKADGGDTGAI